MSVDYDEAMEFLNLRYAVVPMAGDTVVMRTDRPQLEYFSFYAFRNLFMHQKICLAKGRAAIGTLWLAHPGRRTYDGIRFEPGVKNHEDVLPGDIFNSWRGWSVEPKEGSCELYLAHVRDI